MKRILITGANSYVGKNVENWLIKDSSKYKVDTLDMLSSNWRAYNFSDYDAVFHVAGIAHVSKDKSMDKLYYEVNRDLAIETAIISKNNGVNQFIFMSSMIIYGGDYSIDNLNHININDYDPLNAYGRSKLEADLSIQKLHSDSFNVSIIRTPVIYGPDCKGNFPRLVSLAKKLPIVPNLRNQRSMIYIDNFCEFIRLVIEHKLIGTFYPQNSEYVSTSKILLLVRTRLGKKTWSTKIFNFPITFLTKVSSLFRKVYGNKTYDLNISEIDGYIYNVVDVEDSIIKSI